MWRSVFSKIRAAQQGQVIVLSALSITVLLGFTGLAIDVGLMLHTRTDIQKDVDAMALAGAQALCGTSGCEPQANTDALEWGDENGVQVSDTTVVQFGVDCDGATSASYDLITVRVTRHQAAYFARVVGFTGSDIRACATARKFALGGASGVRPFGLEDTCIEFIGHGDEVTLKFDSETTRNCDSFQGNYGALGVDGSGANDYRDAIKYGSESEICADEVPGCDNFLFSTQTGVIKGPTDQGIGYLFENTPIGCDTWDEVVNDDDKIDPACNPWQQSYIDTGAATRLVIIPVVHGMWDSGGNNTIRVKRFAIVFLEDYSCTGGNSCDIRARFIQSNVNLPNAQRTTLTADSDATAVALIK